jgi:hypothetical protein
MVIRLGSVVSRGSKALEEEAMDRRDIEFGAEGVLLRGWFYPGAGASGPAATVVMAHGWLMVRA